MSFPQNVPEPSENFTLSYFEHNKNKNAILTMESDHQSLQGKSVPFKKHCKYVLGVPGPNKKVKLYEVQHYFQLKPAQEAQDREEEP